MNRPFHQEAAWNKPKFRGYPITAAVVLLDAAYMLAQMSARALKAPVWSCFERNAGGALSEVSLISIVDDDQFVRESIGRLMRSFGYTVEVFASAADFLASPRLDETACLIADIHMPAMTGVELHRRLIENGRAIPTILITAYPDDAVRARALNDGIVGYLRKPFDDDDLLRCVRTVLDGAKPSDETS